MIHGAELPRVDPRLPKTIADGVFAQWIDPANLALLDERDRTLVLVLAFTGFRVSSVVTLMRDALEHGPDQHPYLRYVNVKLSREAMLPIPPLLAGQLERNEKHLADWFPQTKWLFPSPMHRSAVRGTFHVSPSLVANVIKRYVRTAEIRTTAGELALDVHPHLFRHHLGTSMVNENIPLPVIAQVLDHGSLEMTARYARLHDDNVSLCAGHALLVRGRVTASDSSARPLIHRRERSALPSLGHPWPAITIESHGLLIIAGDRAWASQRRAGSAGSVAAVGTVQCPVS